jgi:hypothetical protein
MLAFVASLLVATRRYIRRAYLKVRLLEKPDNKWTLKMLLDRMSQTNMEAPGKGRSDELCDDCKSLVRVDSRPIVRVLDRGGDRFMIFHRECIDRTKMRIPVLLQNRKVRLAKLKNLWKLSGHQDTLKTDSPKMIIAQEIIPDGVMYRLLIATEIKIPPSSLVNELSKPNSEIVSSLRQAYEKGPWGAEFYDKVVKNSQSWKEMHAYFLQFMCLAEIYVRGNRVSVSVRRD